MRQRHNLGAIGIIIGAFAGVLWGLAGGSALDGTWRSVVVAVVVFAGATLSWLALRMPPTHQGQFNSKVYGTTSLLQVALIGAGVAFLNVVHQQARVPPLVLTVVGLHFIGLYLASNMRVFVWVAITLVAVGVAVFVWPSLSIQARLAYTGLPAAAVLFAACASAIDSGQT